MAKRWPMLTVAMTWALVVFLWTAQHESQRAAEERAERAEAETRRLRLELRSTRASCDARTHRLNEELEDAAASNATLRVNTIALSRDVGVLIEDLERCRGVR